jgi:uncharacterized protein YjbI with pentapeptide repeats
VPWSEAFSNAWNWYSANRDNLIPIGGLLGGAAIAWAALRQAGIAVRRHHAQTEADRQRRITESFSKAVEQLASDKIEARLGGIYTLERISRESEAEYWPVMEILTAFVRERGRWQEPDTATLEKLRLLYLWGNNSRFRRRPEHELSTDIAAVLAVINRREVRDRKREREQGWHLDFSGADLREVFWKEAHLEGAHFTETHLEGAYLEGAHLEGASFWQAHLEGAYIWKAHLKNADFTGAYLQSAELREAHLEGATFIDAELERTYFERAYLDGAIFWRAHVEGALGLELPEAPNQAPGVSAR